MQRPPKAFIDWYNSLNQVKQNNGPARGSIATALVVLGRLLDNYNLDFDNHVAKGGTQIKGASRAAEANVLSLFGEERIFTKEGGRTNRGGPSEIKSLLLSLKTLNLELVSEEERKNTLLSMLSFLVERVKDYHNREKVKLVFNPTHSTWHIIHNLLESTLSSGKAGYIAQHLVGAKLQLRFPGITVSNESGSTADVQTQRPGDFLIGHTAFHVTVAPMPPVFDKCLQNISSGYKPVLLVPDGKLIGARQIAEQISRNQIAVESLESFISQNINEIGVFDKERITTSLQDLIRIYNERIDVVETDKSLMIELPSNLL